MTCYRRIAMELRMKQTLKAFGPMIAITMSCAANKAAPPGGHVKPAALQWSLEEQALRDANAPINFDPTQTLSEVPILARVVAAGPPDGRGIRDGGPSKDFLKQFPWQQWSSFKSTGRGILVTSNGKWGPILDWTKNIGGSKPSSHNSPYWFLANGNSPTVVYFPSKGEGFNFLQDWQIHTFSGVIRFDAAQFTPETSNGFGLNAEAHLVEFELNRGRGGGGIHFVMTNVKILDGTDEYPIVPVQALDSAAARWESWLADETSSIDALLAKAAGTVPGEPEETHSDAIERTMFPTWYDHERFLRVAFYRLLTRTITQTWTYTRENKCSSDAPCPASTKEKVSAVRNYSVDMAMVIDIDVYGKIKNIVDFGPSPSLPLYVPAGPAPDSKWLVLPPGVKQ
jgi:hypothetical protein